MLARGAATSQASPGSLPMMSPCPDKQNTGTGVAALSPEIMRSGEKALLPGGTGARVVIRRKHPVRDAGKQVCVRDEETRRSGREKLYRAHSDTLAPAGRQRPRWPGWRYLHALTLRRRQLEFLCAHGKRQQGLPLHLLEENQEVALEAVGMPLDVLAYHVGPVEVILLIGQDGDKHLEQICMGGGGQQRRAFFCRDLIERLSEKGPITKNQGDVLFGQLVKREGREQPTCKSPWPPSSWGCGPLGQ